jgi:hypothetical protein
MVSIGKTADLFLSFGCDNALFRARGRPQSCQRPIRLGNRSLLSRGALETDALAADVYSAITADQKCAPAQYNCAVCLS